MVRTPQLLAILALVASGCSPAGRPGAASPTHTTGATTGEGAVDQVAVVPRPAKSIARLRALVRGTPAAQAPIERALAAFQTFDLDEPIVYAMRDGVAVTSFGISRDLAQRLRQGGGADKCDVVDVAGKPRIACQPDADAMNDEARALARIAPPSSKSDIHMEVGPQGIARQLRKEHGDVARFAPFLAPLGRTTFDVSLEGTPEVRFAMELDATKSEIVKVVLDAPVAPPPPTFFRLPADAELAVFAHAPSAAELGPARGMLDGITSAGFAECSPGDRQKARAELDKLLLTGGSVVVAVGNDRARAEAATDAGDAKKLALADRPWVVAGFEEPAERWIKGVTWLGTHACGKNAAGVAQKPAARLGLPAGTVEIVERDKEGPSFTFVVPNGANRTWLAIGADEATLAAHVRATVDGAADATLAGRPGLGSLKGPATFGGFVTANAIGWLDKRGDLDRARAARSLATGGRTPLPFRGTVVKEGGKGTIATRVAVEPAALADFLVLVGGRSNDQEGDD